MRSLAVAAILAASLGAFGGLTSPAHAEKRVFIIANNADGYGVDRCLASGSKCGSAAATAYCRSRQFAQALSFHKVDKDDITGAIPVNDRTCRGGDCDQFVAIECHR